MCWKVYSSNCFNMLKIYYLKSQLRPWSLATKGGGGQLPPLPLPPSDRRMLQPVRVSPTGIYLAFVYSERLLLQKEIL